MEKAVEFRVNISAVTANVKQIVIFLWVLS